MFLDNPLTGLGPRGLKWWIEFLEKWCADNPLTVVATSNSPDDWRGLANCRATLEAGRMEVLTGLN